MGIGITLVIVYEDEVKAVVIKELNKKLKTEVRIDPKDIDLTFVSSFPKCAIEFKNLTAMETWNKKEKDTLIFAGSLSLRFNLKDLFNKKYDIKQIALADARCYLKVDQKGNPNYEVWKTNLEGAPSTGNDSLQFKLEDISLKNVHIIYKDKQQKVKTDFVIDEVAFAGNFNESSYELTTKGNMQVDYFVIDKTRYINNKKLKMDVAFNVNNNNFLIKKADIALNKMQFIFNGDFNYADSLQNLKMNYNTLNLDIESVLSLLPEKHKSRISDYKSSGGFFAKGSFSYQAQQPFVIQSKFGINNATIEYTPKNSKLTNVLVSGELLVNGKESILNLTNINGTMNGDNFSGKYLMRDFSDPYVEVSANGVFNLQNVYSFWPIDTLEKLEGTLKFNGDVKGKIGDLKDHTFSDKISIQLTAEVTALKARFKKDAKDLAVETCKIKAVDRNVQVENLRLIKGSSDVDLTGEIPGAFNYILDSKSPLVIRGVLNSKNINIDDFIYSGTSQGEGSEFSIPANVSLKLDANIAHFVLNKFDANNIKGNFELKDQKAMVSDMTFETMEGTAEVDAYADASGKSLDVTMQAVIKNINVRKMFVQLNNFGQATMTDKNVNGFVNANIEFSGRWNKKLEPMLNTITSSADLTIERGELNDFKPLESLSKFVDVKELQRIKFSSLSSNLNIKNSTIYIPQTTIKNSALNIEFNGTHDFNNNIDYHIRLLISELLAKKRKNNTDEEFGPEENDPENRRSAFILMTGNIDDIKIKYDRKGLKQKIKEDIKQEKKNLKQLFKDEFSGSKKDTIKVKPGNKADQKFELEKPNNNPAKKTLEPKKKKEEEDDDF